MAQDLTAKKSNFLSGCVAQTTALLAAYNGLRQLRAEYTSEGYSSLTQADMTGANAHLTPAILTNLMSTFDTIDALINSNGAALTPSVGYLTNLYAAKP